MPSSERRHRPRDRRQQILSAGRRLFVASDYHHGTMAAIAEEVGITPGAVYRHFANKAVLLEETVAASFDDVAPVFEDGESLRQAIAANCAVAVRNRGIGVLWSREAWHLPEQAYQRLRERLRVFNRFYGKLIRVERPEIAESDSELLAWAVQSVLASPGYHSVQLPAPAFASMLNHACIGLCGTGSYPAAAERATAGR
jgi:AcrR family transcriptional regulator